MLTYQYNIKKKLQVKKEMLSGSAKLTKVNQVSNYKQKKLKLFYAQFSTAI